MKTFEDQVRSVIESNATPAYDKAQALTIIRRAIRDGCTRYWKIWSGTKSALEATGGVFGDIEPISRFHEVFQDVRWTQHTLRLWLV